MKYSVIIPMFNVHDYIVTCVESILNQLPPDSEIIIVDDGSTDGSLAVISNYVEQREVKEKVKILTKANSGASASRNFGIEHALGEYILFMDSDDKMTPNAFSIIDESVHMSDSDLYVFSLKKNKSGVIYESDLSDIPNFLINHTNSVDLINEYLTKTKNIITWQPWSKVFKKNKIRKEGVKFDNTLYCCNDFDFFFKYILHVHSVSFCNKPVTIYTMDRPGRISVTKAKKRFTSMLKAYSNAFSNIQLYINQHSAVNGEELLDYMSYLYICSFDLAPLLDKTTINNCVNNISIHRYIYSYSTSKWSILKRTIYFFLGFIKGAILLQKIRNYSIKHNYLKSISEI